MDDKEILYQVVGRYIDNMLYRMGGMANLFSSQVKRYIFNFIDPYVSAFYDSDDKINSKAAEAFLKDEVSTKIEKFMKEFNDKRGN